jgi:hypothetical protein
METYMKLKIITEDSYLKAYDENNVLIAYLPKGNAPELDLPLLPEIVVEDDVEKLAEKYASKKLKRKIIKYIPLLEFKGMYECFSNYTT